MKICNARMRSTVADFVSGPQQVQVSRSPSTSNSTDPGQMKRTSAIRRVLFDRSRRTVLMPAHHWTTPVQSSSVTSGLPQAVRRMEPST